MIHQCATCKKITRPEDGVKPVGAVSHGLCVDCANKMNKELDILEENTTMKKLSNKLDKAMQEAREACKESTQLNIRLNNNIRARAIEKAKAEYRSFTNYVTMLILADLEKK